VSIFTALLDEFVEFPATSETVADEDTFMPSELSVSSDGHGTASPDNASEHVQ
jgi:hypothetical protein